MKNSHNSTKKELNIEESNQNTIDFSERKINISFGGLAVIVLASILSGGGISLIALPEAKEQANPPAVDNSKIVCLQLRQNLKISQEVGATDFSELLKLQMQEQRCEEHGVLISEK